MIPDHLIDKAARALIRGRGRDPEDTGNLPEVTGALYDARAILEAVAADIWDEGWEQGMAFVTGMERGADDDDLDHAATNPYRASETA